VAFSAIIRHHRNRTPGENEAGQVRSGSIGPMSPAARGLLFLACAGALITPRPVAARAPVVVVDPGHGGDQDGAEGPGGIKEKEIALQIARRVRTHLASIIGARVVLTRDSDVGLHLSDRVSLANGQAPDLFISIHANSMPTRRLRERIRGVETFFLSASASGAEAASTADRENAEGPAPQGRPGSDTLAFILADLARAEAHAHSSRLAYAVHHRLVVATGVDDHGVHQAPFYVLNGLQAPAILIEVGYISHPEEGRKLADEAYQDALGRAIAEGVKDFLSRSANGAGPSAAAPGR
jgi:N-acetylmuramoyl-L-alanine amidase